MMQHDDSSSSSSYEDPAKVHGIKANRESDVSAQYMHAYISYSYNQLNNPPTHLVDGFVDLVQAHQQHPR